MAIGFLNWCECDRTIYTKYTDRQLLLIVIAFRHHRNFARQDERIYIYIENKAKLGWLIDRKTAKLKSTDKKKR